MDNPCQVIVICPLLSEADAERMLEMQRTFGAYRLTLGERTRYFRESYVYRGLSSLDGIDLLVDDERLADAARELHGARVVVPSIVYANLLTPGQELGVHTDLPEYRGADRRSVPQWLVLVMQHSGLFERWRLPIATAITYFGTSQGGSLTYHPNGLSEPARSYTPQHNTAIMFDTDTVYHGVAPVTSASSPERSFRPGVTLAWRDGGWVVLAADHETVLAVYREDELRYSVSWKAYCFDDDGERTRWADHSDDLTEDRIFGVLSEDLRSRRDDPGLMVGPGARQLLDAEYGTTSWGDRANSQAPLRPETPRR